MIDYQYALYRAANGGVWVTQHHFYDRSEFTDERGNVWRRVAVTTQRYQTSAYARRQENWPDDNLEVWP